MLPNPDTELTEDQKAALREARSAIPKLKEQIRRAKQAGIDVSQQEADLQAMEQQLEKIYRVYVRNATAA
jgi:predicted phage gp36 major capsid-like protein